MSAANHTLASGCSNFTFYDGFIYERKHPPEIIIFGVVMSFYLFFHVRGGRVCMYHEVAAKCSTFDEVLLQIAISQKVFEGFE